VKLDIISVAIAVDEVYHRLAIEYGTKRLRMVINCEQRIIEVHTGMDAQPSRKGGATIWTICAETESYPLHPMHAA